MCVYCATCTCTYSPATTANQCNIGITTIDILPDDVLLEIFDFFYVFEPNLFNLKSVGWWQRLAHVCRKWRNIIFEAPRRLNLQLVCTDRTPAREMLDAWPLLPIIIRSSQWGSHLGISKYSALGLDNIVAALEHNDRIHRIALKLFADQQSTVFEAMQEPFPALTNLNLYGDNAETARVIPDSFSGGSAPHLRFLTLDRLPFPGLSKLLLSATGLIHLDIWRIPHSGYISPEAIASCLSVLTRLISLTLGFESPRSRPNRESRRLTRPVLPALLTLRFKGASEYLEDLVARIDAPRLARLEMKFFNQLIFDTPQLIQFITRTPKLKGYDQAYVYFSSLEVTVKFPSIEATSIGRWYNGLKLAISCRQSEWRLPAMAQVCSSSFPQSLIHNVERLYIREEGRMKLEWQDDLEDSQLLELLQPFTGVKYLHLSGKFAPRIASSLQELVGPRTTEVLPALESLYLYQRTSGSFKEAIGKFVTARRLFNLPVSVSYEDESDDKVDYGSFVF